MSSSRAQKRPAGNLGRLARTGAKTARRRLVLVLGGRTRTRVVVVLACVLALSSADTATVGASAIQLRHGLHIDNTDIGLLVAVTSVVGAVFALPFGILADRVRRTRMLGISIVTWGIAMIWSASAGSFGQLLLARLCLGAVMAVAGPTIASLVGDWFAGGERGQIYSYILTGELLGAGAGFAFTGDIAALSWRAAFVILALPAFVLAWAVTRLPEPVRGGRGALLPAPGTRPWDAARRRAADGDGSGDGPPATGGTTPGVPNRTGRADRGEGTVGSARAAWTGATAGARAAAHLGAADVTDAQRLATERGIPLDTRLVSLARPRMGFVSAVRYILAVRTNIVLIVAGAMAYYFLAGVQTFGVEFVTAQYHVPQAVANLLLILVGAGAVLGVLAAGPLGDSLLRRGHLRARVLVAAGAAAASVVLLAPALAMQSAVSALPYIVLGAAALSAQNPPIDAARLDIMPSWLWGRAEGVRTFVRTGAQALAPVLFGAVADYVFGGGNAGLRWTFVVMLAPLSAGAVLLYVAARHYPRDVATAAAVSVRTRRPGEGRAAG